VFGKKQSFSDAQVTNSSLRAQLLMPYWMSCAWRMLTCTNACMHFKLVWILSIRALTLVVGFVFCFFLRQSLHFLLIFHTMNTKLSSCVLGYRCVGSCIFNNIFGIEYLIISWI
jgi:hypothetical protein